MANQKNTNDVILDIPSHRLSFDVEAFDEAIRSQGAKFVHYQALRCPVGMTNLDDNRTVHPDHEGCTNGFLYKRVGTVTGLFIGNSKHKNPDEVGFWDGSTVQSSFPRFYDDQPERRLYVAPFDRFYLDEESIVVPHWQLFMHHETGKDRLKYPIVEVEQLLDSAGNAFRQNIDFKVSAQGQVVWLDAGRPTPIIDGGPGMGNGFGTDKGSVCAIRYLYRPYFYVGQIIHEIRVTQVTQGDIRAVQRMPMQVMLHREYVAQTKDQAEPGDPGPSGSSDQFRTVMSSINGGFGSK